MLICLAWRKYFNFLRFTTNLFMWQIQANNAPNQQTHIMLLKLEILIPHYHMFSLIIFHHTRNMHAKHTKIRALQSSFFQVQVFCQWCQTNVICLASLFLILMSMLACNVSFHWYSIISYVLHCYSNTLTPQTSSSF